MSLKNELIYPVNKVPNYTKKDVITKNSTNIINLILPNHSSNLSCFKLIDRLSPKIYLSKKGMSLKNLNLKQKIPLMKDNPLKHFSKEKKILKSNSENKNIFETFFNKINFKKKKNNSFCIQNNNKDVIRSESINNNKNETFSKLNLDLKNLKNTKSFCASRNISSNGNSEELLHGNKNNNNKNNSRQNKKLKTNKSYLLKNKSTCTYIPKFKTKINLNLYVNQQKRYNYNSNSNKTRIIDNKKHDKNKTYGNIQTNLSEKENININLSNYNDNTNINESILFSNPKRNKKKIALPFSPNSNKDQFFRQIKYKKCYIRNNKNDANIPYNKKNKLSRQNSYYNLNLINLKSRQNKKINNTTREDGSSFADMDIYKKNNSMSSFDLATKTNANSYSYANNELSIAANENNIEYKGYDGHYGVEMNHFRIVKIIQESKSMLIKNE